MKYIRFKIIDLFLKLIKNIFKIFCFKKKNKPIIKKIEDDSSEEESVITKKEPIELIGKERLQIINADINRIRDLIKAFRHSKTSFEGITVHNNGNPRSSALGDVNWALKREKEVSWHYSVDKSEVVRFVIAAGNYTCFSSGDGRNGYGNSKTINIEINEHNGWNDKNDLDWQNARRNAIHLIAQLLYDNNWNTSKIGQHFNRSGKNCPRIIRRDGWSEFIKEIEIVLNKLKQKK